MDEESLSTLLVEVKGIINSRSLVAETINDFNSEAALSPSHNLTIKSRVMMPPTWRVWDTRPLLQKDIEAGTAYQ